MVDDFHKYSEDHAGVTADTIREAATDPNRNVAVIRALEQDLAADEQHVAGDLEGDIQEGTQSNLQPPRQIANRLVQDASYAIGLMNLFASHVDEFDVKVDDLNRRLDDAVTDRVLEHRDADEDLSYNDIKSAEKAKLQGEYNRAENALDNQADSVASQFSNPSPENIERLIRQGFIPTQMAGAWPNIELTDEERRRAYQNAIDNGSIPDFSEMSDEDVQAYIRDNPHISDDVTMLMAAPYLSPALTSLVRNQAAVDADLINDAIDSDTPGSRTLEQVEAATERLAQINASINADPNDPNHKMTAAQADYIENWLDTVGAENLGAIPQLVKDSVRETVPGNFLPPQIDDLVRQRLQPIGDSILNYSNPAAHRPDAGVDQAGYHGGSTFTPADGRITLSEMPQSIQDLTALRLGYDNGEGSRLGIEPDTETTEFRGRETTYTEIDQDQFNQVLNYDTYSGYADLLSSASDHVEGGADYSTALGEQAIQARQDLNAIDETASNTVTGHEPSTTGRGYGPAEYAHLSLNIGDGPMSDMLSVTGRSEDGSSQLLLDDHNRQSLLALDWTDDQGATDVITAGTDRQPGGGGDVQLQARAAAAILGDVGSEPDEWRERMNEGMEDAVLDTGLRWVDTFGVSGDSDTGVTADGQDVLGRDVGPVITMSDADKENFMLFAAGTGDEQAVRFQAGLSHYGDQLIQTALQSDGSDQLKSALSWSGSAEGRMEAANIQSVMNSMGEDHDETVAEIVAKNRETAAHKTSAYFLSSIAGSASSAIPGAGPFISGGIGALSRPIIEEAFQEDPVPDFDSMEDNERTRMLDEARSAALDSRNYRFASLVADQYADDPNYAGLYTSDGQLRPLHDLDAVERSNLENLGGNLYEDFNESHPHLSPVVRSETYDESFNDGISGAEVNLHEDDPEESDDEREERLAEEQAHEDQQRRLWLYGANQSDWDRWNEENPPQPGYRQRGPIERESPYDTVPGANDSDG